MSEKKGVPPRKSDKNEKRYRVLGIEMPRNFDPKRGGLFFIFGLFLFPLIVIWRSIGEADVPIENAIFFTLGASILIGIFGMFTDNVGV